MKTGCALTSDLFRENEISTNRIASVALLIFGALLSFLGISDVTELYDLGGNICRYLVLGCGIASMAVYPVSRAVRYEPRWVKFVILGMVLLASTVVFFLYPTNALFLCYGPIIISAMYYDHATIRWTALLSWILFCMVLLLSVHLEKTSAIMRTYRAFQGISLFQFPKEVVKNHILPHTLFFFVTALLCDRLAKRGRDLVVRQAEITAEAAAMEADVNAASRIQLSALPEKTFRTADGSLSLEAFMRPAKIVGGDFYDYFMAGDRLVFLVGDVSDKGLPAAMFMMNAKNSARLALQQNTSLKAAAEKINVVLSAENRECMFVSMWIGVLDPKTGDGSYVNCGHLWPFVKRKDGSVEKIENSPDLLVGLYEKAVFREHTFHLGEGDRIILYTDGMTDARNQEEQSFGESGLFSAVQEMPMSSGMVCEYLAEKTDAFASGTDQFDDMTVLTVQKEQK